MVWNSWAYCHREQREEKVMMGYWEGQVGKRGKNGVGRNGSLEDKELNLRGPVGDYFINYIDF